MDRAVRNFTLAASVSCSPYGDDPLEPLLQFSVYVFEDTEVASDGMGDLTELIVGQLAAAIDAGEVNDGATLTELDGNDIDGL